MMKWFSQLQDRFLLIGVFIGAALPRLAALGRYITPDELIWVFRSVQFRQAVLAGLWADTLVSGHPGVTTTWLAGWGIGLQLLLHPADQAVYDWITHLAFFMPDNMTAFSQLAVFLTAVRLMLILVNSLGITAIYRLARPLLGRTPALIAALFLAFDPFNAGLSGLAHVDALMTTFATLALLALMGAVRPDFGARRRWRYAALSGALAGGAALTKTPALLLAPLAGLFFFLSMFKRGERNGRFPRWRLADWRTPLLGGVIWALLFVAVIFAAYPALWTAPGDVYALLSGNANRHIDSALRPSFFLGEVAYNHGGLFYPVVLAFRLSPVVFTGLFMAVYAWLRRNGRTQWPFLPTILLLLWSVLYLIGISFAAKKFDRYALAVIPALTLLAAYAWAQWAARRPRLTQPIIIGLIAAQAVYGLAFAAYPLAAYNPLLGGPRVAQKALPIGWGEAVSAAGRWLAAQPGSAGQTAVAGLPPSFAPFFPGQTLLPSADNQRLADYVIMTASGRQSNPTEAFQLPDDFALLHTIHYGGLDQAWIYAQSDPRKLDLTLTDLPEPISFGGRVGLLATKTAVNEDQLNVYARWQLIDGGENGRYTLQFTLRDDEGQAWASREIALTNEVYFYPEYWTPGETSQSRYTLDLPAGLPPDRYALELALFDSDTDAQLSVLASDGAFRGVVYPVSDIEVTSLVKGDWTIPVVNESHWLDGRLTLLGHSTLPETILSGGTTVLDLYWQANALLPADLSAAFIVNDAPLPFLVSRYDSGEWRPGDRVHEKISLTIPHDLAAGTYPVQISVADETAVALGQITIVASDRLMTLPDDIQIPLAYQFGEGIFLRGLDWAAEQVIPGDSVALTLYWQTEIRPDDLISVFVHLVGPDGNNAAQADHWPGGLPSDGWVEGQVIVDEYAIQLPKDAPRGVYQVAVGLYTASDGLRLPALHADGTAVPDNRILLPISLTVEAIP